MTVAELRALLVDLPDNRTIYIESCCGGGCILSPQRVEPLKFAPEIAEALLVITQDDDDDPKKLRGYNP